MSNFRAVGVILCGGRSRRMQADKASLHFGGEPLLARMVRIVSAAGLPCMVVAADGQELPTTPDGVRVVRDRYPQAGPLGGLATALSALEGDYTHAFVAACDLPLLRTEVVRLLVDLAVRQPSTLAWIPVVAGQRHPLLAIFRTSLATAAAARVTAGQLKLLDFVDTLAATPVYPEVLQTVDPHLASLENMNDPAAYARLSALAERSPSD